MRILVVSAPLLGHLLPLLPLAQALRDAGHDVLAASGADALSARNNGIGIEDVAPGFEFDRIARRIMLRHPLLARAELAGNGGIRTVSRLFGAVNDEMADGVVALADRWKPDLVIHEPLAAAGALAAAKRGIPAVLHENTLFDGPEVFGATRMAAPLARHGVSALPPAAATLTIAPPSVVGARDGLPMRCEPFSGDGEVPDWLAEKPERPRILVSRSTVNGPGASPMPAVVAAAAEVDAEIVLVRPDAKTASRAMPENVRTVDWVPINAILPTCAAVVHHGGAGSVFGAFAAGLPQLVTPGPGDRKFNAEQVATRGAGLAVPAKRITAADLTRLITDEAMTAAAAEVREEMKAMPSPADLVPHLESLP
ncbi:nucleotide disphospho-sugar-binding domain-containing protein [Saccharopolyspora sp. NPDC050389]|uniref:nucleotide disphospho-sugar-binding domain-containing protein n=1 Tax=Saccharopolyspora sp. NPDC050389 TaxID=3155516 RepID=UPI003407917F